MHEDHGLTGARYFVEQPPLGNAEKTRVLHSVSRLQPPTGIRPAADPIKLSMALLRRAILGRPLVNKDQGLATHCAGTGARTRPGSSTSLPMLVGPYVLMHGSPRRNDVLFEIREATSNDEEALYVLFAELDDFHAEALPEIFR